MSQFDISLFRREPSLEEISAAKAEIHRQEQAIATIKDRIHTLRLEAHQLNQAQKEHEQIITRCKGVVTLARRIPEEIVANIFEHCAEDWPRAPIVASHVCSAWRKAALTPRIWSHIYVNGDSPDAVSRTRFWLSRSRQAPLYITVASTWWTPPSNLIRAMDLLSRHALRWHSLTVESSLLRFSNLVISRCTEHVPCLREITINTEVHVDPEDDSEEETFHLAEALNAKKAPNLREVHFSCNALPHSLTFPPHIHILHLSMDESLSLRPLLATSILALLESLPVLEQFTMALPLKYNRPYIPEGNSERIVTLPELTSITMYGPTNLNELLAHLQTPSLRFLRLRSLEDVGYRQEPIGPSLLRFIENSAPPLEFLELHDIDLSPEYFSAAFSALPELRALRIHESSISDSTLRLLSGPAGLCRRLTHLDLRWCGQLSGKALVHLVHSRQVLHVPGQFPVAEKDGDVADPIEEVTVLNCCYVTEQDVLDLARVTVCCLRLRDDDFCCELLFRFDTFL